jgi:Bacteriophage CI repressor helix-turn-helix domain.
MTVKLELDTFVKRLEYLLYTKGISGSKFCVDVLELSSSTYSTWKRSEKLPAAETLVKISDYFDISLDLLIRGKEHEK